jgi:hypothetical protein
MVRGRRREAARDRAAARDREVRMGKAVWFCSIQSRGTWLIDESIYPAVKR